MAEATGSPNDTGSANSMTAYIQLVLTLTLTWWLGVTPHLGWAEDAFTVGKFVSEPPAGSATGGSTLDPSFVLDGMNAGFHMVDSDGSAWTSTDLPLSIDILDFDSTSFAFIGVASREGVDRGIFQMNGYITDVVTTVIPIDAIKYEITGTITNFPDNNDLIAGLLGPTDSFHLTVTLDQSTKNPISTETALYSATVPQHTLSVQVGTIYGMWAGTRPIEGRVTNIPGSPIDLSGTIKTADGTDICAMVLASGQYTFSCNPPGVFSLTGLASENNGTVKRQLYAHGFFPKIDIFIESTDEAVIMTHSGVCPNYNTAYDPGFYPDSAGKLVDISGSVLVQDSQTPICAMVLANGQYMFSCDGTGSYFLRIPLDDNGQFKLQVYADGFAPSIRTFDEFKTTNLVRLARAVECQ